MDRKIFNVDEAAEYIGYKKSYVYKMVMDEKLPFLKPNNGKIFFEREKLDSWMLSNNCKSIAEREMEVSNG